MDILSLTAVELAKAIREGKTTAVEATQAVLDDLGGRADGVAPHPVAQLRHADRHQDADDRDGDDEFEEGRATQAAALRRQHEVWALVFSQQGWAAETAGVLEVFSPDWLIV